MSTAFAAVSAVGAAVLARRFYLERAELRLNPINQRHFLRENESLPPRIGDRIVFFGDSRIERWNPRPIELEAELVWRGIGGETTSQLIARFEQDALALEPSAIVIQGGINDLVLGSAVGRLAETEASALINLQAMASSAANAGHEVYLLTVVRPARPSLLRRAVWRDDVYGAVDSLNQQLRQIKHPRIRIVDIDTALASGSTVLPDSMAEDTLHFSATGYAEINQQLRLAFHLTHHAVQ